MKKEDAYKHLEKFLGTSKRCTTGAMAGELIEKYGVTRKVAVDTVCAFRKNLCEKNGFEISQGPDSDFFLRSDF